MTSEAPRASVRYSMRASTASQLKAKCKCLGSDYVSIRPVTVLVEYGPYRACGIVTRRQHRLHGLTKVLSKAGHTVILKEIDEWNMVQLTVHDQKIFSCDIRQLDFGSDGMLDRLCSEALDRVEEAY